MIRVGLKGLLVRKFRSVLTALAIILGVSMISGTFVLTDTISKAFDQIFTTSRNGSSVVISGKKIVHRSTSGNATISASLLPRVKTLAGVEAAAGEIQDDAKIIARSGKEITTFGPPTLGYGIDFAQSRFNPLKLLKGSWPSGPTEVAIDKTTADKHDFAVGDRVGVATRKPVRKFRLTGILKYGSGGSIGGATIAAFDIATAQQLFDKKGQFDTISIAAKQGFTASKIISEIKPIIPSSAQVKTAAEQAKSEANDVKSGLSFLQYFLLAFGGISLFVGAFVIFNTLSITVAQRIREFATLRTLGASRRQVLASVVLEALIIGAVSSVIGLAVGIGLAKGLAALFVAFGVKLPSAGTVIATRTIIVALVVGVVVAVLAGLGPALRATRVPPISAVREGATLPKSRLAPFAPYIAGADIAVALAVLLYGMFAGGLGVVIRLVLLAVGCLLLFIGVALLSSRLVGPIASALGIVSERIGGAAGRLARENSVRNPGRTAATAAALMIGLALVTFVAVLGQGLRTSVVAGISRQLRADYVVTSQNGLDPFPAGAGDAVKRASVVRVTSNVRGDSASVEGSDNTVTGIEPDTITKVYHFEWKSGSNAILGRLGNDGVIVSDRFAKSKKLHVGSPVTVVTSTAKVLRFVVRGTYKAPALGSLLGVASISIARYDATFPRPRNLTTFIDVRGRPSAATETALKQALVGFPDAKVRTRAAFIDSKKSTINQLLSLLYVLLALSVVVSLFGMVNTLALSILERTREIGMLRAIGMTRSQVRRMARHESVLTALIGAALGLPLGLFLGVLVTQALKSEGIVFGVPTLSLIIFAGVAVFAGILAAVLPARRAARLNVLEALRYE